MFQERFAEDIFAGFKRTTIRPVPKRMPRVDDFESWRIWTGKPYRSPTKELAQVVIASVQPIRIRSTAMITLDGHDLEPAAIKELAIEDGFESAAELYRWFLENHGVPFAGILIEAQTL